MNGEPVGVTTRVHIQRECPDCGGHGSLHAAAAVWAARQQAMASTVIRCEVYGHPMSEGT